MRNDDGTYSQPDSSSDYWVYESEPHTVYLYQHLKQPRKGRWLPVSMPMFPPKPVSILAGRHYKTRCGIRVMCVAYNQLHPEYPWIFIDCAGEDIEVGRVNSYAANGRFFAECDSKADSPRDIVSEWTE